MHKSTKTAVLATLAICALCEPAWGKTRRKRAPAPPPAPAPGAPSAAAPEEVQTFAPAPATDGLVFTVARTQGASDASSLVGGAGSGGGTLGPGSAVIPDVSARVGYRLDTIVAYALVDLGRLSVRDDKGFCREEDSNYEENCKTWESVTTSVTALTLGAGARYFFSPPGPGEVAAYGGASVFVTVPMIGSSNDAAQKVLDKVAPGTGFGASVAGGAEYFFSGAFSLGGEAGLRLATMGFSDGQRGATAAGFYSSILLNFYL